MQNQAKKKWLTNLCVKTPDPMYSMCMVRKAECTKRDTYRLIFPPDPSLIVNSLSNQYMN